MKDIKKDKNKFYIGEDVEHVIAEITFISNSENNISINHTFVSDTLRGQGIGVKLVNKVVELARQENKKIIPICPYAHKILTKSDEYKDVLYNI